MRGRDALHLVHPRVAQVTRDSPGARRLRLELAPKGCSRVVRHGRPGGPTYQVSDRHGGLLAGDTDHEWRPARIIEWARALPDSDDSYHWHEGDLVL
jgi:hypothetical protein